MTLPFRVILITDWSIDGLVDKVGAALSAGPGVAIQHRQPNVSDRTYFENGLRLRDVCQLHQAPLFVSRRLDGALALGAHLHLPSSSLSPSNVRGFLPADKLISVSIHNDSEVDRSHDANIALVSPVYSPGSKPGDSRTPLGERGFHALASKLQCEAFALGGINAERLEASCPFQGVAVISHVLHAADPKAAMKRLLSVLHLRSLTM